MKNNIFKYEKGTILKVVLLVVVLMTLIPFISGIRVQTSITDERFICEDRLMLAALSMYVYLRDHDYVFPSTKDPNDEYYWIKPLRPYLDKYDNKDSLIALYNPKDCKAILGDSVFIRKENKEFMKRYPSSYVADPKIAGKNIRNINPKSTYILKDRSYPHDGYCHVCAFDLRVHSFKKGEKIYFDGDWKWNESDKIWEYTPKRVIMEHWFKDNSPYLYATFAIIIIALILLFLSLWRNRRGRKEPGN